MGRVRSLAKKRRATQPLDRSVSVKTAENNEWAEEGRGCNFRFRLLEYCGYGSRTAELKLLMKKGKMDVKIWCEASRGDGQVG